MNERIKEQAQKWFPPHMGFFYLSKFSHFILFPPRILVRGKLPYLLKTNYYNDFIP